MCDCVSFSGCANTDPTHPDYIPSVNIGYKNAACSIDRYKRKVQRQTVSRKTCELLTEIGDDRHQGDIAMQEEQDISVAAAALVDLSTPSSLLTQSDIVASQNYATYATEYNFESLFQQHHNLRVDNDRLRAENAAMCSQKCLEDEISKKQLRNHNPSFRASFIDGDDKKTTFYTGLPNHQTFLWVVTHCASELPSSRLLSTHDVILLVLMKLQLNLVNQDLAYRFDISTALCISTG